MARPHKSPTDRHSESVRVSLRPVDLARIQAQAEQAKTTVTDFVRASALGHEFKVVKSNNPDFETIEQLRRIGVNLNQIAKRMNQGRMVTPPEIDRAVSKLEKLLTQWIVDDTANNHGPKL